MVVITTGRTSDTEYDVKALFSECAIHRFLYKVSSLKTMQVELFLDESCLNSCKLLMIKTKTNFASYCFKEVAYNMKVGVSHRMDIRKSFVFARQYRNYFSRNINALVLRNLPIKTATGMVMQDFHGSKTMIFHWIADVAYF